jgi:hypothetical protein
MPTKLIILLLLTASLGFADTDAQLSKKSWAIGRKEIMT